MRVLGLLLEEVCKRQSSFSGFNLESVHQIIQSIHSVAIHDYRYDIVTPILEESSGSVVEYLRQKMSCFWNPLKPYFLGPTFLYI